MFAIIQTPLLLVILLLYHWTVNLFCSLLEINNALEPLHNVAGSIRNGQQGVFG